MESDIKALRDFLEEKVLEYNTPAFIEFDPVQIPHLYRKKEDIEISGFLTSVISWGSRITIIRNAKRMMELMDDAPYDFIMHHKDIHLNKLELFVHRTFNATDLITFVKGLKHLYTCCHGLEGVFTEYQTTDSLQPAIHEVKKVFFAVDHMARTEKHLPDPLKGSAAKRINMFLRWMVRKDQAGVDFGLWKNISPSKLSCPLDVHTGNVARKLGLLRRTQNDSKAVQELDNQLRFMDSADPVKYDFALFGLGAFDHAPE